MPVFLHVGCGSKRKDRTTAAFAGPDWTELRFDINPAVKPDIIGTMTDMSAVASESVDAIFSSHNIEHLYAYEVPAALTEFVRVLRPDGFLVVTCPDIQSVAAFVAQGNLVEPLYTSPAGPISAMDILFGHGASLRRGEHYMAHRCGFTAPLLGGVLKRAGFAQVGVSRRQKNLDLWAVASKSARTQDEVGALMRAHIPASQAKAPAAV